MHQTLRTVVQHVANPRIDSRSAFTVTKQHASNYSFVLLPLALLLTTAFTSYQTPIRHLLLLQSLSWAVVAVYSSFRDGIWRKRGGKQGRGSVLIAACLYAFSQLCHRVAGDREGLWWTKSLLPVTLYIILRPLSGLGTLSILSPHVKATTENSWPAGSNFLIIIVTISSTIALSVPFVTLQTIVLGLCSTLLTALSLFLLENAFASSHEGERISDGGSVSANGSFPPRVLEGVEEELHAKTLARDFSAIVAIICGALSLAIESFRSDGLQYNVEVARLGGAWKVGQKQLRLKHLLLTTVMVTVENMLLLALMRKQGSLRVAFMILIATLVARLRDEYSAWDCCFASICILISLIFTEDVFGSGQRIFGPRRWTRTKQAVSLLATSLLFLFLMGRLPHPFHLSYFEAAVPLSTLSTSVGEPLQPLQLSDTTSHPIDQLIRHAEGRFEKLLQRQSKTLDEAVAEYRRRYRVPPPPNFDRWYEFAKRRGVQLIDEYDTIYHFLLPFWALPPATIRARVTEALGSDENALIGLVIREGQAVKVEGGDEWHQQGILGMMEEFVQFLPDIDLAFNVHDEPRIIVPHDQLTQMVRVATEERMPAAFANEAPRNVFSPRPADMNSGKRVKEVKTTRFNRFAHQTTWSHARLSCSPESPARSFDDSMPDNLTSYALSDLGFVYNHSAFADICMSPSFGQTYGFFDRPNAFNVAQDLIPIFSQSKISSFQDILYPSPWYWYGKVRYNEARDMRWEKKKNSLYWRGSTTGGFSRNGGWRRQHRQRFVQKINAPDKVSILVEQQADGVTGWQRKEVSRRDYRDVIDVKFSHVGQCDPGDCDAQKEFFEIAPMVDQQDAWRYKYLLDIDGNAFSGRFYAFLESQSLVYKMAIFQEWHKDWLKPWVHYVPLSLRGDEWLESIRYFSEEEEGKVRAPRMALQGREWAKKVLRNEDFEVWFFRLLLEYGRIVDDNREMIGYSGP